MLVLCFAPFDQSWLVWISLAPLIAALWFGPVHRTHPLLRKIELGYTSGLVYFLGSLYWLREVTVGGWFILCLYLAVYPALWAGMVWVIATPRQKPGTAHPVWLSSWRNLRTAFLAAAAWVATEWLRGTVFTGFGWNSLGVALHGNIPLIQLSSLTGVGGLSFLAVMTSAVAVATLKRLSLEARGGKIRAHFDFTLSLALVAAAFAYGLRQLRPDGEMVRLKVAAVQPSIPQQEKWNPAFERRIYDTLERLTSTGLAMKPDLLLWPEAATPRGFFEDPVANSFVKKLAGDGGYAMLFGSLILSHEADYNAAIMIEGSGPEPQVYPKSHLVMFGEYIPLRESFPLFAAIVGEQVPSDFDAGEGPVIFRLTRPHLAIGPLICFEDTVGDLARANALGGAQMFVTLSNTGWFRQTAAGRQHLAHAVFRCAETRRPMARCANNGITSVVDRFGRVRQILEGADGDVFGEGIMLAEMEVPAAPPTTLYMKAGEFFSSACLALTFLALGAAAIRRRAAVAQTAVAH